MPESNPSTALSIPDDVRKDLLESQTRQIETNLKLPQIKVMAAGAGLFEFDDTEVRVAEFSGIILGSHGTNVLWDRKFGSPLPQGDENAKFPACSSQDGKYGTPREGFLHAALGRRASGDERIECATCPYNQWGSGNLVLQDKNAKGKAVTNQRSVYVALEGKLLPGNLILPATSIPEFDAYLAKLLNRGKPMQAVVTKFTQGIKQNGGLKWGVVKFEQIAELDQETFNWAVKMLDRFKGTIRPGSQQEPTRTAQAAASGAPLSNTEAERMPEALETEDDDLPF